MVKHITLPTDYLFIHETGCDDACCLSYADYIQASAFVQKHLQGFKVISKSPTFSGYFSPTEDLMPTLQELVTVTLMPKENSAFEY